MRIRWSVIAGFALAAVGLTISGCLPKRVFWSPDGQRAVIMAEGNKAYLTDADGKLSEPLEMVGGQAAWFPDSKRLAVARLEGLKTWEQVKEVLSKEQIEKILSLEKKVHQEFLTHEGLYPDGKTPSTEGLSTPEYVALWVYLVQYHSEGLAEKLGSKWEQVKQITFPIQYIQIVDVQSGKLVPGKNVAMDMNGIASLRISPDGSKIAYVTRNPEILATLEKKRTAKNASNPQEPGGILWVVDAEGQSQPLIVEKIVAWHPDFTSDSKSLVYAAIKFPPQGDEVVLGTIEQRKINVSPQGPRIGNARPLAGIAYFPDTKVVCLKNGEILFSAGPITLPSGSSVSNSPSLFSAAPDLRATVAPMITDTARLSLPTYGFQYGTFDIRPDGGAVTFFEEDQGTVGYYVFATNAVEYVVKQTKDFRLLDVPTWRNNDELSFFVGPGHKWGSPKRPELVLYSIGTKQAHCISKNWPNELMQGFIPKQSETKPASTQCE